MCIWLYQKDVCGSVGIFSDIDGSLYLFEAQHELF